MANQIREDKKEVVNTVVETAGKTIETVSNNKKELLLSAGHGCKEVILSAGHGCKEMIEKVFGNPYNRKQVSVVGLFLFTGLMLSAYVKAPKEV